MRQSIEGMTMARRRGHGFTLIELMIVIVVVGILVAIAVPAYTDSVQKTRRGAAKADMLAIAQTFERCFTNRSSYTNCFAGDTLPADLESSPANTAAANRHYTLSITVPAAAPGVPGGQAFTITAAPTNSQATDRCGTISINSVGVKTETGPGSLAECW